MNSKQTLVLIFTLFLLNCQGPSAVGKGTKILQDCIETYGGAKFFNSKITFNIEDLYYSIERKDNLSNFVLTRQVDSIEYKATYQNGSTAYFINDSLQEETLYSRRFIEARLEGLVYLFSIPHIFDQNSVVAAQEENVTIGKKEYLTLHIWFRPLPEDPENEFYLYIDPETKHIDFFTEKFDLNGESILFKKAINKRTIKGLLFSDYNVFRSVSEDSVSLDAVYKNYNNRSIEYLTDIVYENFEVEILKTTD